MPKKDYIVIDYDKLEEIGACIATAADVARKTMLGVSLAGNGVIEGSLSALSDYLTRLADTLLEEIDEAKPPVWVGITGGEKPADNP